MYSFAQYRLCSTSLDCVAWYLLLRNACRSKGRRVRGSGRAAGWETMKGGGGRNAKGGGGGRLARRCDVSLGDLTHRGAATEGHEEHDVERGVRADASDRAVTSRGDRHCATVTAAAPQKSYDGTGTRRRATSPLARLGRADGGRHSGGSTSIRSVVADLMRAELPPRRPPLVAAVRPRLGPGREAACRLALCRLRVRLPGLALMPHRLVLVEVSLGAARLAGSLVAGLAAGCGRRLCLPVLEV